MAKSKKNKRQKPLNQPTNKTAKARTVAPPAAQEHFSPKWKAVISALLAAIAMAVYAPSFNYDFVYDDDAVLTENRFVKAGFDGLKDIWTTSYFQGYDLGMVARAYRPVPLTTLAIQHEMSALDPVAYHVFNILFYGLTAVFLFLFLAKLLRKYHPFLPVVTTLLFMLHPIHLEVVANIKSRDTLLAFLNFAIAGWLLLKHLDTKKIWPLAFSLLFYAIAAFSKEETITTLAVIPLMLYVFREMKWQKAALYTLPYLAIIGIFLMVRSGILGGLNEGVVLTKLDNSLLGAENTGQRVASTIWVIGHYLYRAVFPHILLSDYSFSTIPLVNWDDWRVYASILANLGLFAAGFIGLKKREVYGFAALFYFATISIFTSVITPNVSAYNDRFLYTPVLGMTMLFGWLVLKLVVPAAAANGHEDSLQFFFKKNFIPVAVVALLGTFGIFKITGHLPYWKNRYVLFEHDAKQAPNNARMRKNNGGSLARLAVDNQTEHPELSKQYAEKAVVELTAALGIFPNMPTGHIHLGNMHLIQQDYPKAEAAFRKALEFDPDNYFALTSLAQVFYRLEDFEEALRILNSIGQENRTSNYYYMMALCYNKMGDQEKYNEYLKLSGRQ